MPGVRMRCAQKMSRAHNYEVNVRSDPRLRAHASLCWILRASQITSCLLTKIASELETLCWILTIPFAWSRYPLLAILIYLRIYNWKPHLSISWYQLLFLKNSFNPTLFPHFDRNKGVANIWRKWKVCSVKSIIQENQNQNCICFIIVKNY